MNIKFFKEFWFEMADEAHAWEYKYIKNENKQTKTMKGMGWVFGRQESSTNFWKVQNRLMSGDW